VNKAKKCELKATHNNSLIEDPKIESPIIYVVGIDINETGYYYQLIKEMREKRLANSFWMIYDNKSKNMTRPKTHETEEEAWKAVIKEPFDIDDYKRKGYTAINVDMKTITDEYLRAQKKFDSFQ
jgi:hypothetical protein